MVLYILAIAFMSFSRILYALRIRSILPPRMLLNDKWNYGSFMADLIIGRQRADIWDVVSASSEAILGGFSIMMIRGLGSLAMMKNHCEPPKVLYALSM